MRYTPFHLLPAISICCLLLFPLCAWSETIMEQAEVQAAEKFLSRLDDGRYEEGWSDSATQFQTLVTAEEWIAKVSRQRPLFGRTLQRVMKSAEPRSSIVGLPDGDYCIIVFETRFEFKQGGHETVITALDEDGHWRVTGYFLR